MANEIKIFQTGLKNQVSISAAIHIPYLGMIISLAIDDHPQTVVFKASDPKVKEMLFAVDGADTETIQLAMDYIRSYVDDPIPFAPGSIVSFFGEKQSYLVSEQGPSNPLKYCLLGHTEFGNAGYGGAWLAHRSLSLVSPPTADSWRLLLAARDGELTMKMTEVIRRKG